MFVFGLTISNAVSLVPYFLVMFNMHLLFFSFICFKCPWPPWHLDSGKEQLFWFAYGGIRLGILINIWVWFSCFIQRIWHRWSWQPWLWWIFNPLSCVGQSHIVCRSKCPCLCVNPYPVYNIYRFCCLDTFSVKWNWSTCWLVSPNSLHINIWISHVESA